MTHPKKPFIPKKSLGQNFLVNPGVIRKIFNSCSISSADTVLEIGPGQGALTHSLAEQSRQLIAVEKDDDLAQQLAYDFSDTNVNIIQEDILKYSFDQLPQGTIVVGNLPYNITTPIIEKIIQNRHCIPTVYMTVQLEYGQRIAAVPNTKAYGPLSCFIQYYADTKILFKIKNTSFYPVPKVHSCFMRLDLHAQPKYPAKNETHLFQIIHASFGQRRKTIQNSLSSLLKKSDVIELLHTLHIDPTARAEQIELKDFIKLADMAHDLMPQAN